MKDPIVITELRNRGFTPDKMDELLRYEAIEAMPRVLDKPPKRITLRKASNITRYGCCAEFILCYNEIKASTSLEQAVIDLPNGQRFCDVPVYVALLTLIQQGFCKIEDRASACFELFKVILTLPVDTITVGSINKYLSDYVSPNYYTQELLNAIKVCILNEKLSVIYWERLCDYSGFYRQAIDLGKDVIRNKCETEKDVDEFLRPLLKDAKQDKEFMESVYKEAANKWLIPMLYYLRESNPSALNPTSRGE